MWMTRQNVPKSFSGSIMMAVRLVDAARVLRSKNAGPLYVTFDIIFDSSEQLDRVLGSGALDRKTIAAMYGVEPGEVQVIPYNVVHACKVTIPRKTVSGNLDDNDIYGCQQHMKLAGIMVPE